MIEAITYYTHNKFNSQSKIERHIIKFHELTILLSGEMTYYVNDEKYIMTSGDIIYISSGSIRRREMSAGTNDYVSINFHSDENLPLEILSRGCINNELKILINYFDSIYSKPTPQIHRQKLSMVLSALIMQISDNLAEKSNSSLSTLISSYLAYHYREKITLQEISELTYFSAAYCESEFRKHMGKSIIQYLIDLRIEEAKRLLAESSMSCSRIAGAVGFDDANYFSRIFKKRTGYSPLRYREFVGS